MVIYDATSRPRFNGTRDIVLCLPSVLIAGFFLHLMHPNSFVLVPVAVYVAVYVPVLWFASTVRYRVVVDGPGSGRGTFEATSALFKRRIFQYNLPDITEVTTSPPCLSRNRLLRWLRDTGPSGALYLLVRNSDPVRVVSRDSQALYAAIERARTGLV